MVGEGDFVLTNQIKELHDKFSAGMVTSEKYERRIIVEGLQLSQPQTIQIEDERKVQKMIEEQEMSILNELG